MESKQQIRKRILEQRSKMTTQDVEHKSRQIANRVFNLPEYQEADHVLLYADFCHEVMTKEIFDDALLQRKKVYFPKCNPAVGTMEFYQIVSVRQLTSGYNKIKEPTASDETVFRFRKEDNTVVVVPGIAFDVQGHRIGYGKGYYDRYLQDKRQVTTVALAFAEQIVEEVPFDKYDIRMDKIVTEEIIYSFLRF